MPDLISNIPAAARPSLGLVLSGGGSRTAYQAGALKALAPYLKTQKREFSVVTGSSIGSLNGLVFSACLRHGLDFAISEIERLWTERDYRNTFHGSPSMAFLRAIKVAVLRYSSPGPCATNSHIFDPRPLIEEIDKVLSKNGSTRPADRHPALTCVGIMTTKEGVERKPLFFACASEKLSKEGLRGASFEVSYVSELKAKHGLASAALPSVLPPVELDLEDGRVRLVDGGISANVPVDPALRFGAQQVIVLDASGREWWFNHYGHPLDTRPPWEVPAGADTFCLTPSAMLYVRNKVAFGPLLRQAVSGSLNTFIKALGPTWPIFSLLKRKMGEDLAYEVVSYVALDGDYIQALIEQGYKDGQAALARASALTTW